MKQKDLIVNRFGARFLGQKFSCAIGRGGFCDDKQEGDGASPTGIYHLEQVYYRPNRIRLSKINLPKYPLRHGMGWSDDPNDPAYNQLINRPHRFSHETLIRPDPLYDVIGVISANRNPVLPGKGSAIFLHIWRKPRHPTEGCIAFAKRDLLWILHHWHKDSRIILQG